VEEFKSNKRTIFCPMITSRNIGGGIKSTISLMNGFVHENHEVHLLLPKDCTYLNELHPKIKTSFFEEMPVFSLYNPIKYLRLCRFVKKKFLELPNQTIFFCSDRPALMLALFISKKETIFYVSRGWFYTNLSARFLRLFLFPKVSNFVGISDKQVNLMKQYAPSSATISLIQNGISLPSWQYKPFNSKAITFVTIGGICHRKNQMQCLELIIALKDEFSIHLDIYGTTFTSVDEAYKLTLDKFIEQNNLSQFVTFKGHEKDINKIYSKADIVLSTALEEGFGRTVIEAMAFGIPVVASDKAGGPSTIINHEIDGLLFDGSTIHLNEKIVQLIENENLRNTIINNALKKVQSQYSDKTMANNYSKLIQNAKG